MNYVLTRLKYLFIIIYFSIPSFSWSQLTFDSIPTPIQEPRFIDKVDFGLGLGLSFSPEYTNIAIAPSAIYNFNKYIALGGGIEYSFASSSDNYNSTIVGANIIVLVNPIPEIQLSVSLNEVNVSNSYKVSGGGSYRDNFWNTGLFLGIGYRINKVTTGFTYNVLFNPNLNLYSDAIVPFVRVYF